MQPVKNRRSLCIESMLVATLLCAGCQAVSASGLAGEAQALCEQPFGLFALAELSLALVLAMGFLGGALVRAVVYLCSSVSLRSWLGMRVTTSRTATGCVVLHVHNTARSTSFWSLRRHLTATPADAPGVIVDLSDATVVKGPFLTRLHALRSEWASAHKSLEIVGLNP